MKPLDAEEILQTLAELRRSIPYDLTPRPADGDRAMVDVQDASDFESAAVAEGLEGLADELSAALARAAEEGRAHALRIYYATEELARDPANAHLIPHVEAMRRAYERDYGVPIPARPRS